MILQTTYAGAAFFAGDSIDNTNHQASVIGAVAAAHYIRAVAPAYGIPVVIHTDHCAKDILPWLDGLLDADELYYKEHGEPLFSSHMVDLSEEDVTWNIQITAKYLKRAAAMKQWLEMEIGVTGGMEDTVNHEHVDTSLLYTQSRDIHLIYTNLKQVSPYFSIAASFGNVHGVYKAGYAVLRPHLLRLHQEYVQEKEKTKTCKPVFFVFHGGSGSSAQDYADSIRFGTVKVNLDTDLQWAYLSGVRNYVMGKKDYLATQVGNPEGSDKSNKKYYHPRAWLREAEKSMTARVKDSFRDFNAVNQL
ncbi:Fructose-bisphosphate aldolase 1 [Sporothrix eucalyptigena]|uniref:Fructose-bisphosphate aldolase n=1 Tax=Sporothrix eucalyptigena TaxID=1812306 RepID=A0ABP0CAY9_9PEZI